MKNIGIIGKGFVGSAVSHAFSEGVGYKAVIRTYDINTNLCSHTLEETASKSDFLFVSVPTPTNKDGSINLNILKECINNISHALNGNNPVILIRSTIVPGSTRTIAEDFPNLRIVFNPEFLTERSAKFDFLNQSRFIIGGNKKDTGPVKDLFRDRFGKSMLIIETNYETAELIKYMCNTYFATRISFLNEMKIIADNVGADWDDAMLGFLSDKRIGQSHSNIPGHDGRLGFGGSCFPKDIQALISFGKLIDIDLHTLKGAWQTNLDVRPERDWELLVGRSITDTSEER